MPPHDKVSSSGGAGVAISRGHLPGQPSRAGWCACKHKPGHGIRSAHAVLAEGLGWQALGRSFPARREHQPSRLPAEDTSAQLKHQTQPG